ncbi:MAG: DedA family protein [Acidiferrobacterales bacterium]|nr:DedA family protein [Acidiferrobacterales bacterium]
MKIFEPIYTTLLGWAGHRHADRYLAGISFAESSFFPIPPDVMLAPMVLAKQSKAWRYALICTLSSVLGGLLGYFIGAFFFDAYGAQILDFFHAHEKFEVAKALYNKHGMLIVLLAGFTPIPYKIFTIASGAVGIAIVPFMLMSAIGRGARFFLVAGLVRFGGEKLETTIHKQVEWLGWITIALVAVGLAVYKLW